MSKQYDAFLSYSGRDRLFAQTVHEDLERAGLKIFIDSQLAESGDAAADESRPPDSVLGGLDSALKSARSLMLLVTPESVDSAWVQLELEGFASRQRKRKLLFLDLEWAPIPERYRADRISFERDELSTRDYAKRYRDGLDQIRQQLVGPGAGATQRSRREHQVPYDLADRLPKRVATVFVNALLPLITVRKDLVSRQRESMDPEQPADRVLRGLCAALDLPYGDEFKRKPLCDHEEFVVNHLLVLLQRSHSPWRGALRLARVLHHGFNVEKSLRDKLADLIPMLSVRIDPEIDDRQVSRVKEILWPRYEITGVLGGSTTITLKAEDLQLERPVAIKVLRPLPASRGIDNKDHRLAFMKLARDAAIARCTGLGSIHGVRFDEGDDGILLLITELLPDESIAALARCVASEEHPEVHIATPDIRRVLRALGEVLTHVILGDYVHLDVSSHSIFVDKNGLVTLSPLGITAEKDLRPLFEYYRALRGTILECPEIESGSQRECLTGPSRQRWVSQLLQFRLGRIAVDLLFGESAWSAASTYETNLREVRRRLGADLASRPQGGARLGLADALLRLLAPEPGQRFETLEEGVRSLVKGLQSWDYHGEVVAKPLAEIVTMAGELRCRWQDRHHNLMDSLSRALANDLVPRFRERLWSNDSILKVFERKGTKGGSIDYERKLDRALRVIAQYGGHEGYRPVRLDEIAVTHGEGYQVESRMYDTFRADLLATLQECDPELGDLKTDWDLILRRIVRQLQSTRHQATLLPAPRRTSGAASREPSSSRRRRLLAADPRP